MCCIPGTYLLWCCESPLDGSLVYHPMQCEAVVDVQEKRFPLKTMSVTFSFQVVPFQFWRRTGCAFCAKHALYNNALLKTELIKWW